ncbi:uncharacterized protein LOC124413394 isoform X2 [Diprion similis]|uniref:uncharacterized protein LOC124413394 isoform X2 n=1 Tax=Diprion similis TaxID=362088 RepID=UPI001EF96527|nr:uncharacterized protein LOC124413394 isoform X2 [Diprion similis]
MGSSPEKCCCQSPRSAPSSAMYNPQRQQPHPPYDPMTQQPSSPQNQNQPCHSFTPYNPPCPSRLYPEPKKSTFGSTIFTGLIILSICAFLYYYYYTYVLPRTGFRNLTRSPFYEGHNPTSFHLTRSTVHGIRRDVKPGQSTEPHHRCTRVSIDSSSRRQDSSDNLSGHGGRSKSCLDGVPRSKTRNAGI